MGLLRESGLAAEVREKRGTATRCCARKRSAEKRNNGTWELGSPRFSLLLERSGWFFTGPTVPCYRPLLSLSGRSAPLLCLGGHLRTLGPREIEVAVSVYG